VTCAADIRTNILMMAVLVSAFCLVGAVII
jgi:hypothetical protein